MYAHNQQWLASRARTHSLKAPAVVCHLPPTVRSAAQHSTAQPPPPPTWCRARPACSTGKKRSMYFENWRPQAYVIAPCRQGRGGRGGAQRAQQTVVIRGLAWRLAPTETLQQDAGSPKTEPKESPAAQQPSSPKRHTLTLFSPAPAPVPQYTTTPSPPQQHSPQPASPLRAPSPCGRQTPPAAPP